MNQSSSMDILKFDMPKGQSSIIKVIGVGGGGNNAVNHMYSLGIKDVDFINCNTDRQVLERSPVPVKLKLGAKELGAGSKPEVGRAAAEESKESIRELLEKNTKMLFIAAGMGGGTGTGGAPVIAAMAQEMGILTVGIVTAPFSWEGKRRNDQARSGILELKKFVDIILVIENDKLREQYGDRKISEAFKKADDVLASAARSIAEVITKHGLVNLDFEDVNTIMSKGGEAIMGVGEASGEGRALHAVEAAINSPLLNNNDLQGAHNVLLHVASGTEEVTMDEVAEVVEFIQQKAGNKADVIWGFGLDTTIEEDIRVSVIATGFEKEKLLGNGAEQDEEEVSEEKVHRFELDKEPTPVIDKKVADIYHDVDVEVKRIDVARDAADSYLSTSTLPQNSEEEGDYLHITEPTLIKKKSSEEAAEKVVQSEVEEMPKKLNSVNWYDKPEKEVMVELNKLKAEQLKSYGILNKSKLTQAELLDMEATPAYLRKNVRLADVPHSSESQVSRYTLFDGELSESNSFLHDNVD